MDNLLGQVLALALAVALVVGGIILSEALPEDPVPTAAVSAPAVSHSESGTSPVQQRREYDADWTGERIAGSHFFGCIRRDHFEELATYASQGDQEMFSRALAAGLVTELCCQFEKGEPVYLMDVAVWSGLVKLRRPGEST